MKNLFSIIILSMFVSNMAWAQSESAKPFALVELFSSEGCSSCPPADDLLRSITSYARQNNQRVYTLSFQVDYWNYLGWQDPFSSARFSQRQQGYSSALQTGVYTPEMVINGRESFVGSNQEKAKENIDHYLNVQPDNSIDLTLDQSGNNLKIKYALGHQASHSVINFALVERGLVSNVTAGENNGRTLEHDNVVRKFQTIDVTNVKGSVEFSKPDGSDPAEFSVIAFVQSKGDLSISAASSVDLK